MNFISPNSTNSTTLPTPYTLQDYYNATSFASRFDFFTASDPTNGYVDYVSQAVAETTGLYRVDSSSIYIGVDHDNVSKGRGRQSVRISSKDVYNEGLFILDLEHMPDAQCGTWPAFWLLGSNWPENGEVDIIEGVNNMKTNSMSLHTTSDCRISRLGNFTGHAETADCDVSSPTQPQNSGCRIEASQNNTYGTGFNSGGGGVYATEWTSEHLAIWFFTRNTIPADITAGHPDPANWGAPLSQFSGACDIGSKLGDQRILFDITFCGDWAGQDWDINPSCSVKAASCTDYVQHNPHAFNETYWQIRSLQVYQNDLSHPTTNYSTMTVASMSSHSSRVATGTSTMREARSTSSLQPIPIALSTTFALSSLAASSTPMADTSFPSGASASDRMVVRSTESTAPSSFESLESTTARFTEATGTSAFVTTSSRSISTELSITKASDSDNISLSSTRLTSILNVFDGSPVVTTPLTNLEPSTAQSESNMTSYSTLEMPVNVLYETVWEVVTVESWFNVTVTLVTTMYLSIATPSLTADNLETDTVTLTLGAIGSSEIAIPTPKTISPSSSTSSSIPTTSTPPTKTSDMSSDNQPAFTPKLTQVLVTNIVTLRTLVIFCEASSSKRSDASTVVMTVGTAINATNTASMSPFPPVSSSYFPASSPLLFPTTLLTSVLLGHEKPESAYGSKR